MYDKRDTTFAAIQPGDSLIIVSYKDDTKQIPTPKAGVAIEQQVQNFPSPIIADEIHIQPKEKDKQKKDSAKKKIKRNEKSITVLEALLMAAKTAIGLLAIILLLPLLYLIYRLLKVSFAANTLSKADQVYKAALYRFHMAGIEREAETPLDYATSKVDPALASNFEEFMRMYLRLKYSNGTVREGDQQLINNFAKSIGASIRSKIGIVKRIGNYFNIFRASRFFQTPNQDNQSL
jgi:hypothetical protein